MTTKKGFFNEIQMCIDKMCIDKIGIPHKMSLAAKEHLSNYLKIVIKKVKDSNNSNNVKDIIPSGDFKKEYIEIVEQAIINQKLSDASERFDFAYNPSEFGVQLSVLLELITHDILYAIKKKTITKKDIDEQILSNNTFSELMRKSSSRTRKPSSRTRNSSSSRTRKPSSPTRKPSSPTRKSSSRTRKSSSRTRKSI